MIPVLLLITDLLGDTHSDVNSVNQLATSWAQTYKTGGIILEHDLSSTSVIMRSLF